MHFYRINGLGKYAQCVLSPDFDSIIPWAGGECCTVGRASERSHAILVSENTANFNALHRIPQVNQIVVVTAKYQPSGQLKRKI